MVIVEEKMTLRFVGVEPVSVSEAPAAVAYSDYFHQTAEPSLLTETNAEARGFPVIAVAEIEGWQPVAVDVVAAVVAADYLMAAAAAAGWTDRQADSELLVRLTYQIIGFVRLAPL